jgi:hypothetical protein
MADPIYPGSTVNPFDLLMKFWAPLTGGAGVGASSGATGGGGVPPSFSLPMMNPVEIDKRIGELRSFDTRLALNLEMLRASIQVLESQKTTIAAFQSMQGNVEAALEQAAKASSKPRAPRRKKAP